MLRSCENSYQLSAISYQLLADLKIALPGGTQSYHKGRQRKIINLSVSLRAFSVFSVFLFFIILRSLFPQFQQRLFTFPAQSGSPGVIIGAGFRPGQCLLSSL
jgi:hypothetical protein